MKTYRVDMGTCAQRLRCNAPKLERLVLDCSFAGHPSSKGELLLRLGLLNSKTPKTVKRFKEGATSMPRQVLKGYANVGELDPKQAVPGIPQAGKNIAFFIEALVYGSGENRQVGIMRADSAYAFGGGHQINQAHAFHIQFR